MPNILITGAAKRIGRELTMAMASDGYSILLHYNNSETEMKKVTGEIEQIYLEKGLDAEIHVYKADLSDPRQIEEMMKKINDDCGNLDVLVNNASNFFSTPFDEIRIEEWDQVMAVNLRAPFHLSQLAVKLGVSSIVNISDLAGIQHWPSFIHHGASKAALIHLTGSLAKILAPDTRVNCIIPGLILAPDSMSDDMWQTMINSIPLAKDVGPDALVKTLRFLLDNEFMTGSCIRVDGGEYLGEWAGKSIE